MIGRLRGALLSRAPPWLLVEAAGVGYEVEVPMSTIYRLPELGAEVILHTHLQVREDAHQLFGFATEGERALFRALLKISGVGAKLALAVLSGMEPPDFAACVREGNVARLTRLPGVGKKTAERLVLEMRDRLDGETGLLAHSPGVPVAPGAKGTRDDPVDDAVSALIALGYRPADASRYVQAVTGEATTSEEIIRLALKALVR
jgi:Holliday junction DNA helicase RuvA